MKEARPRIVCGWLAALAAAALPVASFAQLQATQPAAGPLRPPALLAPGGDHAVIRAADKILVLPFTPLNPADAQSWIGKAVQQSLVADLLASAPKRVATPDEPAANIDQAIAAAKKAGAGYVVTGTFLSTADLVRVTGQIIDATNGQPVSGLMVTGVPGQIFRMEDGLAMQVKAALMPDVLAAQEQAAQQQIAQQPPAQPTTNDQYAGVRTDIGAATPTSTYYSVYAYPTPANAFVADTERYYYSYPPTIYSYNTFTSNYGVPLYGIGLFSFPYCYTSPFLRVNYGIGRTGLWGRDWHSGHAWHSGWQHHDHHVAGTFNFQPAPGITNSTQIDYAGVVSGRLTNIGANRAIVPNRRSSPQRVLTLSNASISAPIGDPPGSVRAHSTVLLSGLTGTMANSRTHISYHSFAPDGAAEPNARGQIVIRGHHSIPGNGPLIIDATGQPVTGTSQSMPTLRSLPGSSTGMNFVPPPTTAAPSSIRGGAPPSPPPSGPSGPPPSAAPSGGGSYSSGGAARGGSSAGGNSSSGSSSGASHGSSNSAGAARRGGR
jgi:TolB-like protein